MHKLNIAHKNLKAVWRFLYPHFDHALTLFQTNILVDSDGHPRIAGLGVTFISSPMPGIDIGRLFHGAAPELADPQHFESFTAKAMQVCDMYAFGVLSWEASIGLGP